jgi:hypothetical protein
VRIFLGDAQIEAYLLRSTYASGSAVNLQYQDNQYGLYQVQMDSMSVGNMQLSGATSVVMDTG